MKKVQMLQEILTKMEDRTSITYRPNGNGGQDPVVTIDLEDARRVMLYWINKEVNRMDRAKRNKELVKDLVSGEMITRQEYERRKCEALGAAW